MRRDPSVRWSSLSLAVVLVTLLGCGDGGDVPTASMNSEENPTPSVASDKSAEEPVTLVANSGEFQSPAQADEELHPEVVIKTNMGSICVRLNWEKAPRTVANFLYNYVESGFYDQTLIHYVEHGYLLAAGGYSVDYQEKPTEPPIPCEADNQLSNRRGTIAMARRPGFANSATSQFFINLVDNPGLDYRPSDADGLSGYCVFGQVIEGMDVVDKIAEVPVQTRGELVNTPAQPVIVESITRVK